MAAYFAFKPSVSASAGFDPMPDREAGMIESDAEAIRVVRHLAASFRPGAIRRDHARIPPSCEIESLTRVGFFGMTVPRAFGGAGVSAATLAESLRILSAADAAIGQIAQNHFCWLATVADGAPEQTAFFFSRFLAGDRIGHVHSADVGMLRDSGYMIRRSWGGWRVSGVKHYAAGARSAQWLAFTEPFEIAGRRSFFAFFADAAAHGVTPAGDEPDGGTVVFDDAFIPDFNVFPLPPADAGGRAFRLNAGLIHAAIALGIAEDALSDASVYVRDLNLSWIDGRAEEDDEQPFVVGELAKFGAVVRTAGVLLGDAARAVDQARTWPSTGTVLNARLAVADARLLCSDVASRISETFFLLADVCATLGRYGLDRHRRHARMHALNDPLQWWECHLGGAYLNGRTHASY